MDGEALRQWTIRKRLIALGALFVFILFGFLGLAWWALQPYDEPQSLPPTMISAETPRGAALLKNADAHADYSALSESFVAQRFTSFCGVASSVTVLSAMGRDVDQRSFFTQKTRPIRSRMRVVFGGMPLGDLGGLLRAHGAAISMHYGDTFGAAQFRETVVKNLANSEDFLLVNYQRAALGQDAAGHISPIAAYHQDTDLVLILDTASHKYPYTWVPLEMLVKAMATIDPERGKMRGYIEVIGLKENPS
jgi:hypothetical protein